MFTEGIAILCNEVEFTSRHGDQGRPSRQAFKSGGLFAERVELSSGSDFDFRWSGTHHYLAFHDIRLREGEVRLEDALSHDVLDLRNRLTFAPRGSAISGWSLLERGRNSCLVFTFDPALLERELERSFWTAEARPLLYFSEPSLSFVLQKMSKALCEESPDKLYLEALCLWAALEIERLSRPGVLTRAGVSGRLSPAAERKVRDYIQANLAKDLSLSEIAAVAGLSRFHFSRSFRNSFGMAPRQYLLWSRVERAKLLIMERDLTLVDLSAQLGFKSPARLSAAFKRHAGCTIGHFQRQKIG